jgi:lipoprotein-releasing system permease protein
MNGFRAELMSKILGVNSHLVVRKGGGIKDYDKIAARVAGIEGVVATTPFIYDQVMVKKHGIVRGAILRGLNTKTAGKVIGIESMIKEGRLSSLDSAYEDFPSIIAGSQLCKFIGVRVGDLLTVVSPHGKLTPLGRIPHSRSYKITALFDSGMYDFDAHLIFVSLKEAQDFLGMEERVTGIEVKVTDEFKADVIGAAVQEELRYPYWTQDWKQRNRPLLSALRLEKLTMFVILTMIVLVGALNIISTLVMVVMEKTRDVAILRAMGATARSIMAIFMFQGLLVGVVGTIAGLIAGLGLCQIIAKYKLQVLPSEIYYISTLPVRVETWDVVLVALAAVVISFLATIYPSWHASRLNPVEALRYE